MDEVEKWKQKYYEQLIEYLDLMKEHQNLKYKISKLLD